MKRVQQVLAGEKQPGEVGCRGPPMFISDDIRNHKGLFYLDCESFFLIPVAHCLLYGLVRRQLRLTARRQGSDQTSRLHVAVHAPVPLPRLGIERHRVCSL